MDELLKAVEEIEIVEELEGLRESSVASSCTYVRSPSDVIWMLHENPIGDFYVPSPASSDSEDTDWEEDGSLI